MLVVAACSRSVVFSKGIPGRGMCCWLLGWTVAGCSQGVFFKIIPLSGHVLSATPPVSFVFACLILLVPPTGGHRQDLAAVAAGRRWLLERRACTGRRGISKRGSKQCSKLESPPRGPGVLPTRSSWLPPRGRHSKVLSFLRVVGCNTWPRHHTSGGSLV